MKGKRSKRDACGAENEHGEKKLTDVRICESSAP
jgi:hypothetical protein